jgi:hypothetical protein
MEQHKHGSCQLLMWKFWTCNVLYSKLQCYLMHNGLWTSPWIWILCQGFAKNCPPIHCYVPVLVSCEGGKINNGLDYEIYGGWKDFLHSLTFMKPRLQNKLCEHLDLVVCMYVQPFYIVDIFFIMMSSQHGQRKKTQRDLLVWNICWIMDGHYSLYSGTLAQWLDGDM